ncbi:hypothetical protein HH214_10190 [Mucilaginibacter robiniae]|uniref:Adhesin n=1 Tax=Mucilaginibacter robiniae TaxID=2728022 RepID=A0A7L5E1M4_9SPHI|nr:hypothetical protein [Mucilaginibacter robiniae]QJD96209.1 hypothetical protein HH214_10190 [Mucilaginibacter robiniae]
MSENFTDQIQNREQLKKYFRNGQIPSEVHYHELINSMVHKTDDGFSKDQENGLNVYNYKAQKSLLSFYADVNDIHPYYQITKDEDEPSCLKLRPFSKAENSHNSFFFNVDGSLGVGKKPESNSKIDIDGFAAMQGRIGTYKKGAVRADGKWHAIIEGLDNCHAFEVIARAGKKGTGRFSMMHAIAISAYGPSGSKIQKLRSYFGWFWNKLNLRWRGTTHNFRLEIRTNINYGRDAYVNYNVTQLWNDELFLDKNDIYDPNREA